MGKKTKKNLVCFIYEGTNVSFINDPKNLDVSQEFNNCETTFKKHLEKSGLIHNLSRYKRSQFTTSLKGEHTNWRVAKYNLYFYKNLMIKYPDEFIDSCKNLLDRYGLFSFLLKHHVYATNYYYLILRRYLGRLKKLNF